MAQIPESDGLTLDAVANDLNITDDDSAKLENYWQE